MNNADDSEKEQQDNDAVTVVAAPESGKIDGSQVHNPSVRLGSSASHLTGMHPGLGRPARSRRRRYCPDELPSWSTHSRFCQFGATLNRARDSSDPIQQAQAQASLPAAAAAFKHSAALNASYFVYTGIHW